MTSKTNLAQPAFNDPNWNVPLNSNFGILDDALGGTTNLSVTSSNVNLSAAQSQTAIIAVTGLTAARSIFIPTATFGTWVISNYSSFALTVYNGAAGVAAGVGVTIPAGYVATVYSPDGNNIYFTDSDQVRITGSTMTGNLVVGASSVSGATLTVNNTGAANALVVSGGNVTTSGQFTASNNVTAYSDLRLKENIETIENALEIVKKMRGITFNTKKDGTRGAGFVAQELQEVFPDVVYEDYAGYLHIAYGNITSVLVNAVKELAEKVEKLENKG
jgi:hypothetical protein